MKDTLMKDQGYDLEEAKEEDIHFGDDALPGVDKEDGDGWNAVPPPLAVQDASRCAPPSSPVKAHSSK
jgi:hypothetical protein